MSWLNNVAPLNISTATAERSAAGGWSDEDGDWYCAACWESYTAADVEEEEEEDR